MIVTYDKSFSKSLDKVKTRKLKDAILTFITKAKKAETIKDLKNIRKLSGFKTYYRYRIGDYRLGFELISNSTINLVVLAKRNDIYKKFP